MLCTCKVAPFARSKSDLVGWKLANPQEIGLLDVVQNAKPTVLIGVSGQAGAFTEEIIRAMVHRYRVGLSFGNSLAACGCYRNGRA